MIFFDIVVVFVMYRVFFVSDVGVVCMEINEGDLWGVFYMF